MAEHAGWRNASLFPFAAAELVLDGLASCAVAALYAHARHGTDGGSEPGR